MNCAYYLTSKGFVFWILLHSAEYVWHWCFRVLLELISIYFSVFPFAEHGSYTSFRVRVCSKPIRRLNVLAGSDALDGPSLFESRHSSVPSPPASGNRSNQPNLPSRKQGSCFFLLMSRLCPLKRNSPPTLPCDSQDCWWDATLGLSLCKPTFCCGP